MDDRSLPTSVDLMYLTLKSLQQIGGEAHRDAVYEVALAAPEIDSVVRGAEDREAVLHTAKSRVGFSLSNLKNVGALENSSRGRWKLTAQGRYYLDLPDGDEVLRHREHELRVGQRPENFFDRVRTEGGADGLEMTVRGLLAEWDVKRRGSEVVTRIQRDLNDNGIVTLPRFDQVAIDDTILVRTENQSSQHTPESAPEESPSISHSDAGLESIPPSDTEARSRPPESSAASGLMPGSERQTVAPVVEILPGEVADFERPSEVTIGTLPSAGSGLVMVRPQTSLAEAIDVMESNDFSQLAVGSDRQLKGSLSWANIARATLYGDSAKSVQDAMLNNPVEVAFNEPLLLHVGTIAERGFVFVRGPENRLTGIVTSSDLSVRFEELAKPFLLIGDIEVWLRAALDSSFSPDELAAAIDQDGGDRDVTGAESLSFGEYVWLLQKPENWEKLGWRATRTKFCEHLHVVREIRNEVMHFSPEPIGEEQIAKIENLLLWIQRLATSGRPGR